MKNRNHTPEQHTFDRHLSNVMGAECKKHNAPQGIPCFRIHKGNGDNGFYAAICNQRALRVGYNGKVSAQAIRANGAKHFKK